MCNKAEKVTVEQITKERHNFIVLQKKSKYIMINMKNILYKKKGKVMKSENTNTENIKDTTLLEDIIFYIIIVPLIVVSITIICQRLRDPEKIPDIFGYKMFIVLDEKMDEAIDYGDLVFTHNIDPDNLEKSNLIAFRNNTNKVTIHRIINITKKDDGKMFEMQNSENEVGDTKYVEEKQVEGIVIHKISKIGIVLYKIQEPYIILTLIGTVLLIGLGAYYIAGRLDKRDYEKSN